MNYLLKVGAVAITLLASWPVLAQSLVGTRIVAPAGYLPGVATYCDNGSGQAVVCAVGGGGGAVTAAPNSYSPGFSLDIGTIGDAAYTGTGSASLISIVKGHSALLTSILSTLGSAPMQATGGSVSITNTPNVALAPGSSATLGIVPSTVYASTGNTFKTSAGNLYSVSVVNSTAVGFLVAVNLASVPSAGASINAASSLWCMPVAASAGVDKVFNVPARASAGITILFSTSCTTYTAVGSAPIQITAQYL